MKLLPKINHLQIFQFIIQHGSIRAAAVALNQTQPALSRAMNELEKMLGAPLMVRGTRGVVLTEAGKLFVPRMQFALKELERAVNEVGHISYASHGMVAIGSSSLPSFTMLPAAIQKFQRRFSQVNILLKEGHLPEMLESVRAGTIDFAIGATLTKNVGREFITEPFFTMPFRVLARRGYPLAESTSVKKLRKAKWYLPSSTIGYHHQLGEIIFPHGQDNASVVRGNTTAMAIQMVLNAGYLTIAPQEILQVHYLKEHLCSIPIEESLPDASYSFIYSQHLPLTTVARNLMYELRKESENYPWSMSDSSA